MDPLANQERAPDRQGLLRLVRALGLVLLLPGMLGRAQDLQPPGEPTSAAETQPAAPARLTSVHGVVRNAATGAPLPRVLARIEGSTIAVLTDGEGRFELDGVTVGPQIIQLRKPGFLDRPFATEDVGYQNDGPAHSVLVVDGMAELNLTLTPTAAIHGRIELSTGDPAEGIAIHLLKRIIRNGRAIWAQNGVTKTNGSGAYRFAGLPAGVYALYTQPTLESDAAANAVARGARIAQSGYPTVFYPEAREVAGATRIQLKPGDQFEANLLLTLEPFYRVTATAILPNGKPFEGKQLSQDFFSQEPILMVEVLDTAGRPLAYHADLDAATHSIEASLPDGAYTLLVGAASRGRSPSGDQNTSTSWGFAEVSVEDHGVTNVKIPLSPMPSWPIQVNVLRSKLPSEQPGTRKDAPNSQQVAVMATTAGNLPMNDSSADAAAIPLGAQTLEMNRFGFGPHWISTQVYDRSLCVDSFSAGGVNLAREPLNIALGGSPPPMELTLRDDCAKLELALPPQLAEFLPGEEPFYTVYVVPDFDTTVDIPPMTMHPSSGRTLTVDGLTPGSYHVYVFDAPVRLEYRNPAVLAALPTPGQAVTLSADETGNLMLEVPGR